MATMATPNRPRVRSRGPESDRVDAGRGEGEYDLLTAALLGAAVGATVTYLLRRGPRGSSPLVAGALGVVGGARQGARLLRRRRRALDERARDAMHDAGEHLRDYLGRARETIDDVVDAELRSLRKAIRHQRRRVGL